jgi:hypothetical protein
MNASCKTNSNSHLEISHRNTKRAHTRAQALTKPPVYTDAHTDTRSRVRGYFGRRSGSGVVSGWEWGDRVRIVGIGHDEAVHESEAREVDDEVHVARDATAPAHSALARQ